MKILHNAIVVAVDKAHRLRSQIQRGLPEAIEAILAMVVDRETGARARLKAFEALADRGGLPAVKATLTQNINANVDPNALMERKVSLLEERKAIAQQMISVKGLIESSREEVTRRLPKPHTDDEPKDMET